MSLRPSPSQVKMWNLVGLNEAAIDVEGAAWLALMEEGLTLC